MYACMYVCMCTCMYVCMYVCVYACIHVCMHVYVYLCKVFYILHAYMLSLHNLLTYGSNIEDNFLYGREATSCQEDLHTHHSVVHFSYPHP